MPMRPGPGEAVLRSAQGAWWYFSSPCVVVTARCWAEVRPALRRVEALSRSGCYAVGFVRYEAAPAFDAHLPVVAAAEGDLLWFGIYSSRRLVELGDLAVEGTADAPPVFYPLQDAKRYAKSFIAVQKHITAGECYQVNYTFPLRSARTFDAWHFFRRNFFPLAQGYLSYVDTGWEQVASSSPELFFAREGNVIRCRPMKGTRPRGDNPGADEALRQDLVSAPKDRAENLMIVDMVRNDLGRIADAGSVVVEDLLAIEEYATVWQMVSGVKGRSTASLVDIFSALFPCASVTGAPKDASMRIIAEQEGRPRGIYTGCIGYVLPGGDARFSVAIRTLQANRDAVLYNVGSGLVADSKADDEYAECLHKARVLGMVQPAFSLLETLLRLPDGTLWLENGHWERLRRSAFHFGYAWSQDAVDRAMLSLPKTNGFARVRLLLRPSGECVVEQFPLVDDPRDAMEPWRVCLDDRPVTARADFLRHKTTVRDCYDEAMSRHAGYDDVLLYNSRGYLTESCKANIVLEDELGLWTPPSCLDLLPGVLRERLLASGQIQERKIRVDELPLAKNLWLINSLRGWIRMLNSPNPSL